MEEGRLSHCSDQLIHTTERGRKSAGSAKSSRLCGGLGMGSATSRVVIGLPRPTWLPTRAMLCSPANHARFILDGGECRACRACIPYVLGGERLARRHVRWHAPTTPRALLGRKRWWCQRDGTD
ncbi:hypothetical protein BDY17DRAFT_148918 [Neohortaea acidophila]|uniref:Uncharacterized protein n=1 Tax=Neohortaea acidophila TaxID=245834 RepID=A0A6A6PUC5_9PEZI|nr:uncharacterized protein BDY17DRAFT_148918 [Neohortaea acidophila]KAF2483505.1 hypothetical protein BDY17DRAFT_148918 [Neohortaea acidophila]